MKISMFTNTFLPHIGGVARSVSTFAEDLRAAGHRVQIIAPTFPNQEKQKGEDVIRVPAIQNFNGSDFSVRIPLAGTIREAIDDFQPDIIHSHHPFLLGDSAIRIGRHRRLPVIFTHHTLYEQYTHYVPLDSPALKQFVRDLATQYANLCNHVIAPSTAVRDLLMKRGVRSSIDVLPTGVDVDYFSRGNRNSFRDRYNIPDEAPVIGHVGRLAREKNLLFLVEAVARAVQHEPDTRFLVAGSGDAEADIRRIFDDLGLENSLIMTGSLTGSDLADCYAAMDVFAFTSRSETQGLVLVEAMAASVPVVALSASGVDDVMQDGINGILLASSSSEEDFSAALLSLANDRKRLQRLKKGCHQTASEFSREKSCSRLADIYQELVLDASEPHSAETDMFDDIRIAISAEWELIQQKTAAALHTFSEN